MWYGSNKSDGLHNKGPYHKWQYKVTFFCIKILCINPKRAWQPLLPSAKGLSIYFYVESSPSQISARIWEHCCHAYALCVANVGCIMTGSFLPWITMFSQSLIFKGALHLCFAVSERASEIPSCYIILWLFWESVVIRDLLLLLASWLCHWYE